MAWWGDVLCGALGVWAALVMRRLVRLALLSLGPRRPRPAPRAALLTLGTATGRLAALGHPTAPRRGTPLALSGIEASQNILVLGGIGSGKTTAMIQPLLSQLLAAGTGGLAFDVKGDFGPVVRALAERHNAPLRVLGPGHAPLNLLRGLGPELAASFLKSALLLASPGADEGFWIESATELLRNTLGMLSFHPTHYHLRGAYQYLFDAEARATFDRDIASSEHLLAGAERRHLALYQHYFDAVFASFDEKVINGIRATAAQILSPFNHPDLIESFCSDTDTTPDGVLAGALRPEVLLVQLPLAQWGLGARVVYTLIKLRFFNLLQRRTTLASPDAGRAVFFLCDEYQEIVSASKDGLSDLNFWDKSRSLGVIGLVSAQSVTSFYAAIGHRPLADALLQNFRQKILFRSEDPETLRLFETILGQSVQHTPSEYHGSSRTLLGFPQSTRGRGSQGGYRSVAGAELVRSLMDGEALALLSCTSGACDDIVETRPLYVTELPPWTA